MAKKAIFSNMDARIAGGVYPRACRYVLSATLAMLLLACSTFQPDTSLPVTVQASPNFAPRRANFVILHHTSSATLERALDTLTSPASGVSSHYLISRTGQIFQLVAESERAWHAGESWWGGQTDMNSASIGIELDNTGKEPFAEAQMVSLLSLLADIKQRHRIPSANFIGHADVAPGRKVDPSAFFPWRRLAKQGFGLWCDAPLVSAPVGFDLSLALRAIGYDPTNPDAARRAFRLHFMAGDSAPLEETEKALAHCLLQTKALLR